MSVLGLAAFGILYYPEYVRQLLRIINHCHCNFASTARRARAGTRHSGARRGRLNGKKNVRTDVSRVRRGRLNGEQPRGQPSAINKF